MQTVEFIPNTLQEEWKDVWNVAHEITKTVVTEVDKERALEWIPWMSQGLLHAPTRGGKNGTRKFKEIAGRFVLWKQRDMEGLIKLWQQARIKAANKLSTKEATNLKGDMARIDRAMRLLRKGAVSRAAKAMER
jgi:hypothetical protein